MKKTILIIFCIFLLSIAVALAEGEEEIAEDLLSELEEITEEINQGLLIEIMEDVNSEINSTNLVELFENLNDELISEFQNGFEEENLSELNGVVNDIIKALTMIVEDENKSAIVEEVITVVTSAIQDEDFVLEWDKFYLTLSESMEDYDVVFSLKELLETIETTFEEYEGDILTEETEILLENLFMAIDDNDGLEDVFFDFMEALEELNVDVIINSFFYLLDHDLEEIFPEEVAILRSQFESELYDSLYNYLKYNDCSFSVIENYNQAYNLVFDQTYPLYNLPGNEKEWYFQYYEQYKEIISDNLCQDDESIIEEPIEEDEPEPVVKPILVKKHILNIEDIDAYVNDDKDSLNNGDTIKVYPGDYLELEIELENAGHIDLEDIEIEAQLENIDDGDDLDDEDSINDLNPDDDEKVKLSFKIPKFVEADEYNLIVEITAEDEEGHDYEEELEFTVKVKKESHNLIIDEARLTGNSLYLEIINLGKNDEDDVEIIVHNSHLGVDIKEKILDLSKTEEEDEVYERTFNINNINDVSSGTYPIMVEIYYDDGSLADTTVVNFEVEGENEPQVVVQDEPEGGVVYSAQNYAMHNAQIVETKDSFENSPAYVPVLGATAFSLSGLLIYLLKALI